eukprot:TRINITY_DN963_c0_g1_i3.p1 TRINITY_DN963_c0_g1~~TRINITY_DN963_c0_g1_i3.p1  ORF type:complete len:177 (+),score=30.84 TRINITY_DN963_c0_g1_i3:139-669(+)
MSARSVSPVLPSLASPPSFVTHGALRFLIFDTPNNNNIKEYIQYFRKYNVVHIVRACEPSTYSMQLLEAEGFKGHEMYFDDGSAPPESILNAWMELVNQVSSKQPENGAEPETIGIHCVAGLGRAPVLVAVALIEHGMNPLEAVAFIRERRRGAINNTQLAYVQKYKPRGKKCVIM